MDDKWADFRFLQNGPTPLWSIDKEGQWWILSLRGLVEHGTADIRGMGRAKIIVMPSRRDMELAIDAGLEFLDRLRERRVPKFIDDPDGLMALCVTAAIRQR